MRRHYVRMFLVAVVLIAIGDLLLFMHPFGWNMNIALGVVLFLVVAAVLYRLERTFRSAEAETIITELPDQVFKARDDLNEAARWVP